MRMMARVTQSESVPRRKCELDLADLIRGSGMLIAFSHFDKPPLVSFGAAFDVARLAALAGSPGSGRPGRLDLRLCVVDRSLRARCRLELVVEGEPALGSGFANDDQNQRCRLK